MKIETDKAEANRIAGNLITKDKHRRAENFIQEILKNISNIINPPTDLN